MTKIFCRTLLALSFLGLTACPEFGILASPNKSAADQDSLKLARLVSPATGFVDGTITVGKGLGYQVSSVDRKTNMVSFTNQSSMGLGIMIGKFVMTSVYIQLRDDDRTIDITANMNGNFDEANQDAVVKTIADFKAGLAKQFAP
jgi:hypothetical protein